MIRRHRLCTRLLAAIPLAAIATPSFAADASSHDILVTARKQREVADNTPATSATVTADTIDITTNSVNVEDTIKYLPSLIVRKRHIGDTQAPLATRTSGLGASARSLIYADGVLLSALIGNNNSSASPRWNMVSPQEIARIDVLYGPFSAAYPGNSIGAVVNIATHLPDALEASINLGTNVQQFDQYGTRATLPAYQAGGTIGDRFGPLALFFSIDHVTSNSQPLAYVLGGVPKGAQGGHAALTRTGAPTTVLGAAGFEHQGQDHLKLKAALDLTPNIRVTYVGGLFRNATNAHAESYLYDLATDAPVFTSAFSSNVYHYDETHWSHAVSTSGESARFDWQVTGTLYDFAHDVQRAPTGILPAAQTGGAGNITRLDGSGWKTLDAKGAWKSDADATHAVSFGAHGDWFRLASNRFTTSDWIDGEQDQLNQQSIGNTRTIAVWAQDAWKLEPNLTLTVGGRHEWWSAYNGVNYSLSPLIGPVHQPRLSADRFSPKAALVWDATSTWRLRYSFGEAWRFPTVGELYQIVTTPVASAPNPNLKPERALSNELAVERRGSRGSIRLSLFNENVKNALISQVGPLAGTTLTGTYVQNVDATRTRGVELAIERTDALPRLDCTGSVTYADSITIKDAAFPAAVGKLLPQVPRWKATAVLTYRPAPGIFLTAAARYASRNFGSLDNSDIVGNTFQGFYKYFVVDLRADFRVDNHMSFGIGVDNANNNKYFLYHPFPQRSFAADLKWSL